MTRELSISNESSNLALVRRTVSEILELTTFERDLRNKIIVAVDEALANVVEHAYQGGIGDINILFAVDGKTLRVHIRDNGVRFEPGDRLKDHVDIHKHIKLGLKGGLGLFLMRRIMDEVYFNHDGDNFVNELVMVKNLPQADAGGETAQEAG